MRLVIQRVRRASVTVFDSANSDGLKTGEIGHGLVLLVGFRTGDTPEVVIRMAKKVSELRIFEDSEGKMNLSIGDTAGSFLVVSQFTLYGDTRRGRRPSFTESMSPVEAEEKYDFFIRLLKESGLEVASGRFGAKMEVEIINDGPVTLILEDEPAAPEAAG